MCKKSFFSVAAVFLLVSSLAFVSCRREAGGAAAGQGASLAGIWYDEEDEEAGEMELFSNGTGVIRVDGEQFSVTWIAENNRLSLTVSMFGFTETEVWDYALSGNTLSLTDQDGETGVMRRR